MESADSSTGAQPPQLPPGFRFHPTDEELVVHYLKKKLASVPLPVSIIAEVDLYKFDPWELPARASFGEQEWYFFSPRDRKYPNGSRPNRSATSGYWKATGTDKPVVSSTGNQKVGVKKSLVFYTGKPPKGIKTNWIMHEYRVVDNKSISKSPAYDAAGQRGSLRLDEWVLCRIYKKTDTLSTTRQQVPMFFSACESPPPDDYRQQSLTPLSVTDHEDLQQIQTSNYLAFLENEQNMFDQSRLLCREDFGEDFIFGGASSAYQTEGAAAEDGKGPSNWDHFTTKYPDRVIDKSNGSIAIDNYHLWKEDVQTMKKLGLHAFRFSISWPRLLPGGRIGKGVNREGVKFYNSVIDDLLAHDITPFVTLFHWDVPQALEDEYQGFLSTKIVSDFGEFAQLCFWEFGDRVKHWITLNEPWSFAWGGYVGGSFAPGRGATTKEHVKEHVKHSHPSHRAHHSAHAHAHVNDEGNPGTEPYIVAHNLLLAHAEAVKAYREFFQPAQKGKIGITLVSKWWEPLYDTPEDHGAALRAVDFMLGWFMEPLTSGKYPQSMIERVKNRLPKFSPEDAENVKGSYDFLGLNYYTTVYATDLKINSPTKSYETDQQLKTQAVGPDGKTPIGPQGGSSWLFIYPIGIYKLLRFIQKNYNDPEIYITENGVNEVNDQALPIVEALKDTTRIKYHQDHLTYVKKAMDVDGVKVKGYIIWAVFDNFEWAEGYTVRFGLVYVDYKNKFTRFPKQSALWLMKFLIGGSSVTQPAPIEEERVKEVVGNKVTKRKFSSVV